MYVLHYYLLTITHIFCKAMGPFSNIKGLTYYRNNDEDPYITLKEVRLWSIDCARKYWGLTFYAG